MVDPDVLQRHLADMEKRLAVLRRHRNVSLKTLTKDLDIQFSICYALQTAIQNVLDIGAHLLAELGDTDWTEYKQIPMRLAKHGIIPKEFVEPLRKMAGMRNILTHEYADVDVAKLQEALRHHLDDFDRFARFIKAYLEREPKEAE